MERAEQLEEIARECLKQRYVERMKEINEYYLTHKHEIRKQYENKIREGIEECKKKGRKVEYIVISMLDSSLLTKSYELQIAFFDENTYLDENFVCRYWSPSFLFAGLEEDMKYLRKKAEGKVIRLKEYETDSILKKYALNYYYHTLVLIRAMTPELMEDLTSEFDCISESIQVLFGKYMDRPLVLYQKEREA